MKLELLEHSSNPCRHGDILLTIDSFEAVEIFIKLVDENGQLNNDKVNSPDLLKELLVPVLLNHGLRLINSPINTPVISKLTTKDEYWYLVGASATPPLKLLWINQKLVFSKLPYSNPLMKEVLRYD